MGSGARVSGLLVVLVAALAGEVCGAQARMPGTVRSSARVPVLPRYAEARTELTAAGSGAAVAGWQESGSGVVPATADGVIEQMSEAAGAIFVGQVVAVRRPSGSIGSAGDAAEGVVEVDFRVERALLGPGQGSVYTLREWAGLWAGGAERYRVGRRLLLFLRQPDASGLSSPVHGVDGAIPLRGGGVAPGPDDVGVAASEWLVDLRWVETHAQRADGPEELLERPPVRGRGRFQSAGEPTMVSRSPRPWLRSGPDSGETEPLSQVLQLCMNAMRTPHVAAR